jgi:hypothetical protein
MATQKLTNDVIIAAIDGFEAQKAKIDLQIAEIRSMLSGSPQSTATSGATTSKRTVSAAARRRMALAQKARWAKTRGNSGTTTAKPAAEPKSKRRISEAGMRNIIEATKRRWALQRALAKKASSAKKKPTAMKKKAA